MMFQDPYSSLNPRMKVGQILGEPLLDPATYGDRTAQAQRVNELLISVGLEPVAADRYPHEFSGRPTPAHRPGARPGPESAPDRRRRARVGARRVDPGPDPQPDEGPPGRAQRSPTSSSATTSRSCTTWPTRSGSCTSARSSRSATRSRCFARRRTPTPRASSTRCPMPGPGRWHAPTRPPGQGRAALAGQPAVGLPIPHPCPRAQDVCADRGAAVHGLRSRHTRRPATSRCARPVVPGRARRRRAVSYVLSSRRRR